MAKRYELRAIDTLNGNPIGGENVKYRSKRRAKKVAARYNDNSVTFVYDFVWRVYDVESGNYL